MKNKLTYQVFKKGSKTFFYSSLFFPKKVRGDIFILYSFVRTADDLVDAIPQKKSEFYKFVNEYKKSLNGRSVSNPVINLFSPLIKKYKLKKSWITAFLKSMKMDITKKNYKNLKDTEKYIYGSAEVVGLMLAAVISSPEKSYPYAQYLGKSMQYINFIRDIDEDIKLGRVYFPKDELKKTGLKNLKYKYILKNKLKYKKFILKQLSRYRKWQKIAEKGYSYIPKRYLIPLKTASDMYKWTADQIAKDPFVVYRKKVKPSKTRIIWNIIKNTIYIKRSDFIN